MSNGYLTPNQAAEYLGLSTSTLAKMRHRGDGPRFFKVGNRVRYSVTDLDAFMETAAATSTSVAG